MHRCTVAVILMLLGHAALAEAQDVRLTGQLRPRFETRDPDFPVAPPADVTMRARLGVAAALPEDVRLRLEIQDVLRWGDMAGPGLSRIDVHQAFAEVGSADASLAARVGRQEMVIGNQRLISNNNWNQFGRRFDGLRGMRLDGGLQGDLFSMRLADSGPGGPETSAWFHGLHAGMGFTPGDTVNLYALYNRERNQAMSTDQLTAGGHTTVQAAGLGFSVEGYYQFGTRMDADVRAWMAAAGVARSFDYGRIRLAYDHYSGDSNPGDGDDRAFDRLFGTGHGFHGYADLFTALPGHTGQRGLGDINLRTSWRPAFGTELELNGHVFRATATPAGAASRFGEEIDLVVRHRLRAPLTLEAGGSFFRTGPAMTEVRGLADDLLFGYLMMTVAF